jgi:hypothetical protein
LFFYYLFIFSHLFFHFFIFIHIPFILLLYLSLKYTRLCFLIFLVVVYFMFCFGNAFWWWWKWWWNVSFLFFFWRLWFSQFRLVFFCSLRYLMNQYLHLSTVWFFLLIDRSHTHMHRTSPPLHVATNLQVLGGREHPHQSGFIIVTEWSTKR